MSPTLSPTMPTASPTMSPTFYGAAASSARGKSDTNDDGGLGIILVVIVACIITAMLAALLIYSWKKKSAKVDSTPTDAPRDARLSALSVTGQGDDHSAVASTSPTASVNALKLASIASILKVPLSRPSLASDQPKPTWAPGAAPPRASRRTTQSPWDAGGRAPRTTQSPWDAGGRAPRAETYRAGRGNTVPGQGSTLLGQEASIIPSRQGGNRVMPAAPGAGDGVAFDPFASVARAVSATAKQKRASHTDADVSAQAQRREEVKGETSRARSATRERRAKSGKRASQHASQSAGAAATESAPGQETEAEQKGLNLATLPPISI